MKTSGIIIMNTKSTKNPINLIIINRMAMKKTANY